MGTVIPFRPRSVAIKQDFTMLNPAVPFLIGTAIFMLCFIALWDSSK